jgi:hypothetical protein
MSTRIPRALSALVLLVSSATALRAQTIDDGIMLASRELQAGGLYSYESWDEYWEGTLKRLNGNIGTITTSTNLWTANYAITDRLNVIGIVPYVWTRASLGVLHGIQGFQDLTLAAKWSALEKPAPASGTLRGILVASAGIPMSNYNLEMLPLSIGTGSTWVSGRGTVNFQSGPGWFLNGSAAYTFRSGVELDRPYFYTDDEFVMSSHVDMPNTIDYVASAGYMKRSLMAAASFSQLYTLGGGDIRRQDTPVPSNRMNVSKVGGMLMYPIPKLGPLAFRLAVARVLSGQNVGDATTITTGLLYTFNGRPR